MMNKKQSELLQSTANRIIKEVQAAGIRVMRLDAVTTESIYLKFDYGLACSVRISTHTGKKKYLYRFNIGPHIKQYTKRRCYGNIYDGQSLVYTRRFYPMEKLDMLISDIIRLRGEKLDKIGHVLYAKLMADSKAVGAVSNGFWAKATDLR